MSTETVPALARVLCCFAAATSAACFSPEPAPAEDEPGQSEGPEEPGACEDADADPQRAALEGALAVAEASMTRVEGDVDDALADAVRAYSHAEEGDGGAIVAELSADLQPHTSYASWSIAPVRCGGTLAAARTSAATCQPEVDTAALTYACAGACALAADATCLGNLECRGAASSCAGTCVGDCDLSIGGTCTGDCIGSCSANCGAEVDDSCVGVCEGDCQGTCEAMVGECVGACLGTCTVAGVGACDSGDAYCLQQGESCTLDCDGVGTTTQLDAVCDAISGLAGAASASCEAPLVAVHYALAAGIIPDAAMAFEQRSSFVETSASQLLAARREIELLSLALQPLLAGGEPSCGFGPGQLERLIALDERTTMTSERLIAFTTFFDQAD